MIQTLASAAHNPTLAASDGIILGSRSGHLGDSLTAPGASADTWRQNAMAPCWPLHAAWRSGGAFQPVAFSAWPGKDATFVVAHIDEIINAQPDWCSVMVGTNDIPSNTTGVAVPKANIQYAVARLRAAKIQPVLCTIPPNNDATRHVGIAKLNAWIKRFGAVNRLPVLDFHSLLVDPATGNYLAGYFSDGTHPNTVGYLAMGQYAANTLAPRMNPVAPVLATYTGDPSSLLNANNMFLTDANSDGIPDSWTAFGGVGGGWTHSIISGDTSILGNWAQIACVGSTNDRILEFNVTTGFGVGDRLLLTGRFTVDSYSSGSGLSVKLGFTGSGAPSVLPISTLKVAMSGVWVQEVTVPTGTTALLFDYIAAAGTCQSRIAQPTIANLSRLSAA